MLSGKMLKISELKPNILIELDGAPYQIVSSTQQMLGRGHAMARTKLKNLETGAIVDRVFRGNDLVKEANLQRNKATYLYRDPNNFYFMDSQTFDNFSLGESIVGFSKHFLKEGTEIEILSFLDKPLSLNLPIKMDFKVIEAESGVKGGRETAGTKRVVIETGFALQVPLFIKEGDIIKVDTRDGKYIERANPKS